MARLGAMLHPSLSSAGVCACACVVYVRMHVWCVHTHMCLLKNLQGSPSRTKAKLSVIVPQARLTYKCEQVGSTSACWDRLIMQL